LSSYLNLVALALFARHPPAVVPFDHGGDGAAPVPRAYNHAPRAEPDSDIRIPPLISSIAITIAPLISVATNLHVQADLGDFEVFRLGRVDLDKRGSRDNNRDRCHGKSDHLHGDTSLG
jgi:hypothetical protein